MALSNKNLRDNAIKLTEDQVNILLGNSEISDKGKNYTAKRVANTSSSIRKIETSTSDNGITDAVHRMVVNNQKLTNTVDNESLEKNTSQLKENTSTLKENTIAKEENANAQKDDISSRVSAMASRGETLTNPESIRKSTTDISKTMTELDQAGVKLMHEHEENFSHVSDIVSDLAKTDEKLMQEHEETFANVSDIVSEMARNNEVLMRDSALDPELSSSTAQFDSNTTSIERNTQAKLENKAATDAQKNAVEQETVAQTTNTTSQSGGDISSRVHELAINGGSLVGNDKEQIKDISATVSELNQSGIKLMQEHEDYSVAMANIISELDQNGQKLMTEHEVPNLGNITQTVSNVEQALTSTATKADDVATKVSELAKNNEVLMKDVAEVGTTTAASVGKVASETSKLGIFMSSLGSEIIGLFTGAVGALNAVFAWVGVISLVATAIYKIHDALTLTVDEANEARENASNELQQAQSDLGSINSELETTKQRIEELESKDALSFTEQSELDKLKEQNKLLEIQADLQERVANAKQKDLIRTDEDNYNKLFKGESVDDYYDSYKNAGFAYNEKEDDPLVLMAQLKRAQEDYQDVLKSKADYENQYTSDGLKYWEDDVQNADDLVNKLGDDLDKQMPTLLDMQTDLSSVDYSSLTTSQQTMLDNLNELVRTYYEIRDPGKYNDMSVQDIFDTKDIEVTKNDLIELAQAGKLDEKTLNQYPKLTKAIKDADLITKDGTNATKAFVDAIITLGNASENIETNKISNPFDSKWASLTEDAKKKLLELAKSGEITPETISSTEEYKTLIDGTGESAESAKNKILNMLSATEKLSGASKGLSSLKTAYQEFADENNGKGFVTASTLESLPDVFKNLPHYDLFEQIVGDPNSGKEKIQSAFNDIAKDYLINQQTLMGVTQENMATYVANLKEMGIQNADEIVQSFVQAQNQQSQLLNEAESEYNNYLQTKDQADLEYLESSSSKNGQLVSALGSAYQGDYTNWCNLLATKAQAYNKFINAIKGSQASLINNTPFQSGTKQAQAIINDVKNHNGRTGGGTSLSLSNTNGLKGLGGTLMSSSAASPSRYTKEQYDAAKSYMDQVNQYNQLKSQLKLDLTNISTNFGGGYSFKPSSSGKSGGGGSGSEKEPTKKDYDWIETLISRINRQVSNLGKIVSATYKTWSTRNNALAQELGSVNQQISAEQQAYNKYMQLANSVGLPEGYASLVRNGTLDVSTIADDDLNEQISQYKQYYEAALDCADTIQDLNDKVAELAKSKFDNISSEYESQLKQIEHSTNIYQSYIDQVEAEDKIPLRSYYEQLIKNENSNINKLKEEYFVLTKAMNEAIAAGKIEKYSEDWYSMQEAVDSVSESIQDANKSLIEYTKSMKELAKTRFDKIATSFDNPGDLIDHSQTYYNNFIDEAEAEGHLASKDYYKALINLENLNLSNLVKESDELNKSLNEALKSGDVEKYSDTWYDMVGKINDVDEAIQDANKSLIEYGNNMRQIEWDLFDKTEDYISKLQDESDFIIDLLSNNELYDENTGNDTKYATALKGLHAVNYNVYMAQADEYAKEIKKLNSEIAKDPSNSTLLERRQELLKAQQDAISGAEDEKQSIKDLVSNGYDKMLDALQKLIDKRKEVLDAEKSLYDYEKSISEKTENLANLRKQWSALQGDNSEEAKTKRQQLETSIKDVESDLQDTEYQQYISDQEKLFDNFYDQTETWLNERLDNLDGIINDVIESTNANAYDISQTISEATSDVGYTLSDEMSRIWDHDDIDSINRTTSGIGSVVSIYGDDFSNRLTTTNTTIDGIKTLVQSLVDDSAKRKAAEDAAEEAAKATQASAQQAKQTSTSTTPSTSTTTKTTTSTTSNKSSSSNSNNSNNSSSGWGSWFVHKTDSFPKSKLDISNSIVDRLKYRDIDSAFNKRKDYYYAMGGTGTYKGSASQNTWMISQMKAHGFKKGGTIGSAIKQTGEDGYILARTGEEVLSLEKLEMLKEALKYTSNISYPNVSSPTIPNFANASQSINSNLDVGGVNIVMNGVNDMQAFSKQMRTALADDVKTQKMIKSMLWNNGMDYKKFK